MTRTALLVGGDGGIGRACQVSLRRDGFEVLVVDRTRGHDSCDPEMVAEVLCSQRLSAVVHAAGSVGSGGLAGGSVSDWRRVLEDNLVSPMVTLQQAAPLLVDGSAVVLLSSVNGRHGGNTLSGPAYAAAKAGVIGLARNAAKELAPRRIRVNAIAPGPVATKMLDRLDEADIERLRQSAPLGTITSAEEIGETVRWLVSDASRSITGAVIDINAGMWMG